MSTDLPYALGCPSCPYFVEVSPEDSDASLSELSRHIFSRHAGYDRAKVNKLLAKARELTADEVTQ